MQTEIHPLQWRLLPDADTVCTQAIIEILAAAESAISARGCFKIVLAGGTTPIKVYRQLAGHDVDWSTWQIYFGDERCLPADHGERNSRMAAAAWLEQVDMPAKNIHPIPSELGAGPAAAAYAPLVEAARPFDLVLLGMGEDGHTASLFPGHDHPPQEAVHAVHDAPKPPPERVSLSRESLSDAHQVLVLVTGATKREALHQWRSGKTLPVAQITSRGEVTVMVDAAASD